MCYGTHPVGRRPSASSRHTPSSCRCPAGSNPGGEVGLQAHRSRRARHRWARQGPRHDAIHDRRGTQIGRARFWRRRVVRSGADGLGGRGEFEPRDGCVMSFRLRRPRGPAPQGGGFGTIAPASRSPSPPLPAPPVSRAGGSTTNPTSATRSSGSAATSQLPKSSRCRQRNARPPNHTASASTRHATRSPACRADNAALHGQLARSLGEQRLQR